MELSRRGMLAGLGGVGGVGAVGFVGAATVTDDGGSDDDGGRDETGGGDGSDGDGADAVPVDPDAPFEARLVEAGAENDGERDGELLFRASDLERVETNDRVDVGDETAGNGDEDDENLVYVSLSADGRKAFRDRLDATDATDDPETFAVSMTLDAEEVRRVDLDEPTVAALRDEEWNGVLELAFESAAVAGAVYGSLAAE